MQAGIKIILLLSFLLFCALFTQAQIENKCFDFDKQATNKFSNIAELDTRLQKTIQSWVSIDQLNENSTLFSQTNAAGEILAPQLGVDLDVEWCYDDTCWVDYGKAIDEVRKVILKGKIFTDTPHVVAYKLPKSAIGNIDFALFQNYEPSPQRFNIGYYTSSLQLFRKQGYPDNKMVLSTSTTTSKGISAAGEECRPNAYKAVVKANPM